MNERTLPCSFIQSINFPHTQPGSPYSSSRSVLLHVSHDGELTTFQDSLFHIRAARIREHCPQLASFLGPRGGRKGHMVEEGALGTHGPQSLHLMSAGGR